MFDVSKEKSNNNENDFKFYRKKRFLKFFSFIGIILLVVFGCFQLLYYKKTIMSIIDFTFAGLLLCSIISLEFTKKVNIISTITLSISFSYFIVGLIFNGYNNIGIIWMLTFPFFAFYLKGKKSGLFFVIIFIISIGVILLLDILKIINIGYKYSIFINLFLVYTVLSIMSFFYEQTTHKSEDIIKRQVYINTLTQLPNRFKLIEDLQYIEDKKLILINIDDFKAINDLYGSKIGDLTLVALANRLKQFYSDNKIFRIYKLHADEFAVLLNKIHNEQDMINIAKKIHRHLTAGLAIENLDIIISASLGISNDIIDHLADADMALKRAKETKKDLVIFEKSMHIIEEFESNLNWIRKLEKSIANDGIIPFYQPIVDNKTGKVKKYECLARMLSNGEIILPDFFLNVAKKSKIYSHITKMMILKTFDNFKNKNFNFSVNISIDDIMNDDTVGFIKTLLEEYNIANKVIFELIETKKFENNKNVSKFIRDMKKRGCRIAIDDFGSGYSNFDYLLRMKVDFIKIDSSIIKNIVKDHSCQIIAETIVNFTKKLNIKTIAEYVYSKKIQNKVKELNIDYSQGFYIGKPEPLHMEI